MRSGLTSKNIPVNALNVWIADVGASPDITLKNGSVIAVDVADLITSSAYCATLLHAADDIIDFDLLQSSTTYSAHFPFLPLADLIIAGTATRSKPIFHSRAVDTTFLNFVVAQDTGARRSINLDHSTTLLSVDHTIFDQIFTQPNVALAAIDGILAVPITVKSVSELAEISSCVVCIQLVPALSNGPISDRKLLSRNACHF